MEVNKGKKHHLEGHIISVPSFSKLQNKSIHNYNSWYERTTYSLGNINLEKYKDFPSQVGVIFISNSC